MKQIKTMYSIICLSQVMLEQLEELQDDNLFKKNNEDLFNKFYEVILDLAENSTDKLNDKQRDSYHYNTDKMRKVIGKININDIL